MLSGNRLSALPQSLSMCTKLELLRLGANNFASLPACLLKLPRLAWLCFNGNPMTEAAETRALNLRQLPCNWDQLQLHERLGEGTSGTAYRATFRAAGSDGCHSDVAVKIFKSNLVSSDGRPLSEIAAWTLASVHANIIPVLRSVADAPNAAHALLMPIVDRAFATVAAPPSMESCTRDVYVVNHLRHRLMLMQTELCRYRSGANFTLKQLLNTVACIASACAHLHSLGT
jgi:hypothetical protein